MFTTYVFHNIISYVRSFNTRAHVRTVCRSSLECSRSVVFLHVSHYQKGHLVREDKAQHTQNHTRIYTFPLNLSMKCSFFLNFR